MKVKEVKNKMYSRAQSAYCMAEWAVDHKKDYDIWMNEYRTICDLYFDIFDRHLEDLYTWKPSKEFVEKYKAV